MKKFILESKILNKSAIANEIGVDPSLFSKWLLGSRSLPVGKEDEVRELLISNSYRVDEPETPRKGTKLAIDEPKGEVVVPNRLRYTKPVWRFDGKEPADAPKKYKTNGDLSKEAIEEMVRKNNEKMKAMKSLG